MNNEQKKVLEFHKACGLRVSVRPSIPEDKVVDLRKSLILEEAREFAESQDLVAFADALADLLYVTYGAAVSFGIDLERVFNEVHRSNMTKVEPDGKVRKNKHGKVVKGEHYSKPNISDVLASQKMIQIFSRKMQLRKKRVRQ